MHNTYDDIIFYSKQLSDKGLIVSCGGNVSVRCDRKIYITCSGATLSELNKEKISLIDLYQKDLCYDENISCEWRFHVECYRKRDDINSVVHTHPVYATVLGLTSKQKLPVSYEAVSIIGSSLRILEYLSPGSKELAQRVGEEIKEIDCLVLAGHGVICVGKNIKEAVEKSIVLERETQRWLMEKILIKMELADKNIISTMKHFIEV